MTPFATILEREIATQTRTAPVPARDLPSVTDAVMRARLRPVDDLETRRQALKRRFRQQVLAVHPDRGGSAGAFIALMSDYERALAAL